MSPLEFMQRLAALVPRPPLHLIRFHGVLAPNAKLRALVVPAVPDMDASSSRSCGSTPRLPWNGHSRIRIASHVAAATPQAGQGGQKKGV